MKMYNINYRIEKALAWCKKNKLESEGINLFDRYYKSKVKKKKQDRAIPATGNKRACRKVKIGTM